MCGIVSVISKRQGGFFTGDLEMFESLLILDTLRGLDSTGVFCVDSARQVGFMKVASHPFHLFATQEYPSWRQKAINSGRILVGHNRKATQGSINSRNAHPFHSGKIILVHNGTLRGDHKKDYAPVDVDSHALAIAFDEKGAENVIPTINGAFALIWWDIEKNRLFAVRNDERPLSIVETDEAYYVLSESWMALQLLAKQGKKVTNVIDIDPGKLYEFKIGGQHEVRDIEVQKDYWTNYNYQSHTGRSAKVQHGGATRASSVQSGKSEPASTTSQTRTTTSPSDTKPGTALTLVKKTDSQEAAGEAQTGNGDRAQQAIIDAAQHVNHPDFQQGRPLLVKFYEMKLSANGGYYLCRGKSCEPATDEIDVLAYVKVASIPDGEQIKFLNKPVETTIVKYVSSSCGPSIYVKELNIPKLVDVHNNQITETEWQYVTTYCKCKACQASIYDEERPYTSVSRKPNNVYSVTCADCVEDSLKGDVKYEFNQNRLASVQAHLGKRDAASGSDVGPTQAAGTTTLH